MPVSNEQATAAKTGMLGFIIGTGFGAILGILYAPRGGEETRRMIREQAERTSQRAKDVVSDAQLKLDEKLEGFNKNVDALKSEVQEMGKLTQRAESVEDLQKRITDLEAQVASQTKAKK